MSPEQYVQQYAAARGSLLYYATYYLPKTEQAIVQGCFSVFMHLQSAWLDVSDSGVRSQKLMWWQQQINLAAQAKADHPALQLLQPFLQRDQQAISGLHQLNAAFLNRSQQGSLIEQESALAKFRQQQYPVLFQLIERLLNPNRPLKTAPALAVWISALQDLNWLGAYLAKGVSPFSAEHWRSHLIDPNTIFQRFSESDYTKLQAFIRAQLQHLQQQSAIDLLPQGPFFVYYQRLNQAVLQALQNKPLHIFQSPVTISPLQALWHSWRCHRRLVSFSH